jgi:hemolysin activation/secretion protein
MRTLQYVLWLAFSSLICEAQTDISGDSTKQYKNNVFIEIGGTAGFYNVGYERQIYQKNKIALYSGIELSYRKIHPRINDVDMVVGLNLLGFTYGTKHQLDINVSIAWGIDFTPFPNSISEQLERKRNSEFYELTFDAKNAIGLGYRYNIKKRWLIRCMALYMFKYDFVYGSYWHVPWGEIGAGFKF